MRRHRDSALPSGWRIIEGSSVPTATTRSARSLSGMRAPRDGRPRQSFRNPSGSWLGKAPGLAIVVTTGMPASIAKRPTAAGSLNREAPVPRTITGRCAPRSASRSSRTFVGKAGAGRASSESFGGEPRWARGDLELVGVPRDEKRQRAQDGHRGPPARHPPASPRSAPPSRSVRQTSSSSATSGGR